MKTRPTWPLLDTPDTAFTGAQRLFGVIEDGAGSKDEVNSPKTIEDNTDPVLGIPAGKGSHLTSSWW